MPRDQVDRVFQPVVTCTYRDVSCRILERTLEHSRLLLLCDHPENAQWLGADEVDIGAYEVVAETAELTDLASSARELPPIEPTSSGLLR